MRQRHIERGPARLVQLGRLIEWLRRPEGPGLQGAALMVAAALALWLLYQAGYYQAHLDLKALQTLTEQNRALEKERADLRAQIVLLERSRQIEGQAHNEVKANLQRFQEEILELREEIAFYRGIVSPAEASTGLRIQAFEAEATGEERLYHYTLVLTQVLTRERALKGRVQVVLRGVRNGQPEEHSLERLSSGSEPRLSFSFRYFQKFEGDMLLPEGFIPATVRVAVIPNGNDTRVERSFGWMPTRRAVP